jgi:hypothetical protein
MSKTIHALIRRCYYPALSAPTTGGCQDYHDKNQLPSKTIHVKDQWVFSSVCSTACRQGEFKKYQRFFSSSARRVDEVSIYVMCLQITKRVYQFFFILGIGKLKFYGKMFSKFCGFMTVSELSCLKQNFPKYIDPLMITTNKNKNCRNHLLLMFLYQKYYISSQIRATVNLQQLFQ